MLLLSVTFNVNVGDNPVNQTHNKSYQEKNYSIFSRTLKDVSGFFKKRNIMKRNFYMILLLLISFAGYSQMYDKNAMDLFRKGNEKVSRKDYTGAIDDFSGVIRLYPDVKMGYENRGVARYYLQDFTGALADYDRALDIDTNDYNTYGRRGWAKFNLQDYKGAIQDFTKALIGVRDYLRYYNGRGQAKYHIHDLNGAIADFDKVINSWPGEKSEKSKAYYWRGLTEIGMGVKDAGCQDLKKAEKTGYLNAARAIAGYCNK
jgi:tetratricopeptide (TPR) repeat protein